MTKVMTDPKSIQEGDYVVFRRDETSKVFQICKKRNIFFEKNKIAGEQLIGQKYGTLFSVEKGQLIPVVHSSAHTGVALAGEDVKSGKDNRDLVGLEQNQKLSHQDIMKMKEGGLSGQAIVEKLVEQSETFKTKTEFSQEKYIKKKSKRHILEFRVLEPNAQHLLDVHKQSPFKICNLRADSLSQLLCYGNVMAGATAAVVESCQGLVLGSVMERIGGFGKVLHLYPGNDMNRQMVTYFNFSAEHMQNLYEFPLGRLAQLGTDAVSVKEEVGICSENVSACTGVSQTSEPPRILASSKGGAEQTDEKMETEPVNTSDAVSDKSVADSEGSAEKVPEIGSGGQSGDLAGGEVAMTAGVDGVQKQEGHKRKSKEAKESQADRDARKQLKMERMERAAKILKGRLIDSLIIATKYHPSTVLQRLLPYVPPSRPVVVFCQHKEPLVECFHLVQEKNLGVQRRLSETWYREYQVLPSRTHPQMSMSGTGGYLFSFTTVADS